MQDLEEKQGDYDPEDMAFRLSAARGDHQPLQEITVYWDGEVEYQEEPSFLGEPSNLTGGLELTENGERNRSEDINVRFRLPEQRVEEYLYELIQDLADEPKEIENVMVPMYKECWIEVTTKRKPEAVGWYREPLGDGIQLPSVDEIWQELTNRARRESDASTVQ